MLYYKSVIILLFAIILFSCSFEEEKNTASIKQKPKIQVPKFNSDSAYSFIQTQVNFGPRVISSVGAKQCGLWLTNKFKNYTDTLIVQETTVTTYDKKNHSIKNFIASFSPEKNNRIALFAHWDTRHVADYDTINQNKPILGANDGGSGVGVLLELARQFSIKKPSIGIDLILFDAEDYGQPENSNFPIMNNSWCLGSQYWAENLHKKDYFARYGILLDMVGAKDAKFTYEETSVFFAENILNKVWKRAHQLGYGKYFIFQKTKQILDDHYYINTIAAIPTIDIIEYDASTATNFNKHWHTHGDNMNNINKKTLNAVGQTLLDIIYKE